MPAFRAAEGTQFAYHVHGEGIQQGAGHYPWLDDAGRFVSTVTAFLNDGP